MHDELDNLRENVAKVSLSLYLEQQCPEFIVEFSGLLLVPALDVLFIAHEDFYEHIVIVIVIFGQHHAPWYHQTASPAWVHHLVRVA